LKKLGSPAKENMNNGEEIAFHGEQNAAGNGRKEKEKVK
jgi:hypothetical protein